MGIARKINFILNSPNSSSQGKAWRCSTTSGKGDNHKKRSQFAPEGCFSVYVGSERQRFVIKAEYANHPLFQMLLEDSELEYGYNCEGPILIPCDVNLFYKVLAEMDNEHMDLGCSIARGPLSPSFRFGRNIAKGYGSYNLLTPSTSVKMNQF